MNRYTSVKVNISEGQKGKLKKAIESGSHSVTIRLNHDDLIGGDVLALTKSQINKLAKAYESGKGVTIKMSKAQIKQNLKVDGGILAAAIPAISAAKFALPASGVGALSGLASTSVRKALGNGLYLKKGGCVCQVETGGKELYLGSVVV